MLATTASAEAGGTDWTVLGVQFAALFTGMVAVLAHRARSAYRRQLDDERSAEREPVEHVTTYGSGAPLAKSLAPEDDEARSLRKDDAIEQVRRTVPKVIICECGFVVRGETEDELIAIAEQHIEFDHPDAVGKITRNDLLGLVEDAY